MYICSQPLHIHNIKLYLMDILATGFSHYFICLRVYIKNNITLFKKLDTRWVLLKDLKCYISMLLTYFPLDQNTVVLIDRIIDNSVIPFQVDGIRV